MTQAQLISLPETCSRIFCESFGAVAFCPIIVSIPKRKLNDALKFTRNYLQDKCHIRILNTTNYPQTLNQQFTWNERIVLFWSKYPEHILSCIEMFIAEFTHPPHPPSRNQQILSDIGTDFVSILECILLPLDYKIAIESSFYYQFESVFLRLSKAYNWKIVPVDMRKEESINKIDHIDFVIIDSPLNWYSDAIDIKCISDQAFRRHALVLVGSNALELYNLRLT